MKNMSHDGEGGRDAVLLLPNGSQIRHYRYGKLEVTFGLRCAHGPLCRRAWATTAPRCSWVTRNASQGRCLGMAVAWALDGALETELHDRETHRKWKPTLEQRRHGRALLKNLDCSSARNLLAKGLPKASDEEASEPEVSPL